MANTVIRISGWLSSDATVRAFDRRSFPGPFPQPGTLPPVGIVPVASGTVDSLGFAELVVPEERELWVTTPSGRRWVATRSDAQDVSAEQERAEGAEAAILAQIEALREEAPGTERLVIGINSNSSKGHAAYWTSQHIYGDRSDGLDVKYDTTPATVSTAVAASLAAGCKNPVVLINTPDPTALGTISASVFAAGAVAIIERVFADHPTVTLFEIVNEPHYKGSSPHGTYISANGSTYGAIVKATYEAVKAAGLLGSVSLLISAFGEYEHVSSEPSKPSGQPFKKWIDEICTACEDPYGMLLGNSSTEFTQGDAVSVERPEAFIFTCRRTGSVSEVRFRTNGVANPEITSVKFGIATDSSGKPSALLWEGTHSGEPGINEWVSASGATVTLTAGVKYHLIVNPLGVAGKKLHYNAAALEGAGTGDVQTKAPTGYPTIAAAIAANEWTEVFDQGPIGFMAGTELGRPLFKDFNAWANHPYGTLGAAGSLGNFNWGSTEGFRTRIATLGAGGNGAWFLTEFGWKVEAEQTANMTPFLEKALVAFEAGWLKGVWAYDDGDAGWSLYSKPGGEALRSFAKAHA